MKTPVRSIELWAAFVVVLIAPLFAFADAATVTIQSLSPSSSVISGTAITFTASSTGVTSPAYSLRDSFINSSVGSANIGSASGAFNWTPVFTDIGTHTLTVTATDSSGNTSASATQNIVVSLVANVSIQSLTPGTSVDSGQNLRWNAVTAGFSATSTTYSVSDSFTGSTVRSSNINSSGNFSWTPSSSDSGSHKLTVSASDAAGNSSSANVTITVNGASSAASQNAASSTPATVILTTPVPTGDIAPGATVTFSALAFGFSSPAYKLSDSFSKTSIGAGNINSYGNFSWTPRASDVGTHNLTVSVSDSAGHSAIGTAQIVVSGSAFPPVISVSSPSTAIATPQISNYAFTSYLKLGITSDEVAELQKILASQGYLTGSATGYFGRATETALKNFQKANGLTALGVVGPQTRTLLNQLSGTVSASVPNIQVSSQVAGASTAAQTAAIIEAKIALIQAQVKILQEQLAALLLEVAKLK